MPRSHSIFTDSLAKRAKADLDAIEGGGTAVKLRAIESAAAHPVVAVAEVVGVSPETLWRWGKAYVSGGAGALCPRAKRPRSSKLSPEQKAAVLSWLDKQTTPGGDAVHWTLGGLREAIMEEFGITLGSSIIWFWLRKEGRKPKVPRPRHQSADAEAQDGFKKKRRG